MFIYYYWFSIQYFIYCCWFAPQVTLVLFILETAVLINIFVENQT